MTALRPALVPALLALVVAGPVRSDDLAIALLSAAQSPPQTVAGLLTDCQAFLTHPHATGLRIEGWPCSMTALSFGLLLVANCEAQQRGEPLPYDSPALAGQAAWQSDSAAMIQTFVAWAKAHPKRAGHPADTGFVAAVVEAFPCPTR